jgi:Predicted 3'-5' exonuclease related to the exonuclease domain of PolB
MKTYIFDIETGPRPRDEIAHLCPVFEAPASYKDPEKIAAAIFAKEAAWYADAALSAVTGRVLAIGYLDALTDELGYFATADEAADIAAFWNLIAPGGYLNADLVGFNSNSFDLPFLVRRSWALGVTPPTEFTSGRWLPSGCRDLIDVWRVGNRQEHIGLDQLARYLGLPGKSGSGADFARLWEVDAPAALAYLAQDLTVTRNVARRLGVVRLPACPARELAAEFSPKH